MGSEDSRFNGLGQHSTAYHFLDLELDILQAPLEVRHLDSHGAVVRGDLDRPGFGHRRRKVDDEHSGCVLKKVSDESGDFAGVDDYPSSLRWHVTGYGSKELLKAAADGS